LIGLAFIRFGHSKNLFAKSAFQERDEDKETGAGARGG
jgi:hypothetical protein